MLFSLFMTTCLAANPTHCVTRVRYLEEAVDTPMKCLTVAQPTLAAWANEPGHDRWRVLAFRCGKPPRDGGRSI